MRCELYEEVEFGAVVGILEQEFKHYAAAERTLVTETVVCAWRVKIVRSVAADNRENGNEE